MGNQVIERSYHGVAGAPYHLPNDAGEQARLNIQHDFMKMVCGGKNYVHPLDPRNPPKKIIDIACGTGVWAIEMAQEFPGSEVIGIDLSKIQPAETPSNVSFIHQDASHGLPFPDASIDLVSVRMVPSLEKRLELVEEIARILRPGGYITMLEFSPDWSPNDTVPLSKERYLSLMPHYNYQRRYVGVWLAELVKKTKLYRDVSSVRKDVPVGGWMEDPFMKTVGEMSMKNSLSLMEAFSSTMLRAGRNRNEVMDALEETKRDLLDPKRKVFWPYDIVYACRL